MATALTFNDVPLIPITHQNSLWIRAAELARALGYAQENSVSRLYRNNADEFTPEMTQVIEMSVESRNGSSENLLDGRCRIFSLRGCHLVAMFARTPVAKAFRRWVLNVLEKYAAEQQPSRHLVDDMVLPASPDRLSRRTDPERKQLTAIINTWVGMAPVHYASARAQVNAHFGVTGVDKLTVAQVKEAIQWVQAKIDALPPEPKQLALPSPKNKFEAYIEEVEAFRARTDSEIRRLLDEGLRLVDVYKFGPEGIRGFSSIFHSWLHEVAVSPSPLVASYWSMDRAMEYSPLYLVREMEKILPNCLHR